MRRLLSKLIRSEQGVALPTVIGALTITTGLAAGTFAVTIQGNHASQRDRDLKRALGAAEAGLQMAALKVSELGNIPATKCVTTAAVDPLAGNECPSTDWIPMGNGARYRYVVSQASAAGDCASLAATSAVDRCITAIGEVNDVRRRLQMRFAYQAPFAPWGSAGLVGKDKVDIGLNKTINSTVGTNGNVSLENNTTVIGSLLLPDGNPVGEPNATVTLGNHAGATLGRVDTPKWVFPEVPWYPTPRDGAYNNNNLLANIPGWDPVKKTLTPPDGATITLPSDGDGVTDFHLCKFDGWTANKFWINVPNGKITRFWIDSNRGTGGSTGLPLRCPNVDGAGTFHVKNQGSFNTTDDKNPAELEFYVYGTGTDSPDGENADVFFKNDVDFYGSIWAPESSVAIWNNQNVVGAITAENVAMKNNGGFVHDDRVRDKTLPGTASAKNLSWFECRRDPTVATDPESGCA